VDHRTHQVVGPISAVPCPWCGKTNDMRELYAQQVLEKGARVDCDHCHLVSEVVVVDTRPRVVLKQRHG
jgi:hypothetical protein